MIAIYIYAQVYRLITEILRITVDFLNRHGEIMQVSTNDDGSSKN